jgi:hypothetical protein
VRRDLGVAAGGAPVVLLEEFGVDVQEVAGVVAAGVEGVDVEQPVETGGTT